MRISFKAEENCDFYCCFETTEDNKILLPQNISLGEFLFFLQSSLDQIKPVLILKDESAKSVFNLNTLKSTHQTLERNFLFLNFSIRNKLKTSEPKKVLKSFEDIHISLSNILLPD